MRVGICLGRFLRCNKPFGLIRELHFYDRVGGGRRVRTADPIPPVLASVDQDFRRQRAGPTSSVRVQTRPLFSLLPLMAD